MKRRKKGTGSLYLRGNIWWGSTTTSGAKRDFSLHTYDQREAEKMLEQISENEGAAASVKSVAEMRQSITPVKYGRRRCQIGAASELLVSVDLMNRGYEVYRALEQHAPCDLLAMAEDGRILRVEVKSGPSRVYSLEHKRRLHDILATVTPRGIEYFPPVSDWPILCNIQYSQQ